MFFTLFKFHLFIFVLFIFNIFTHEHGCVRTYWICHCYKKSLKEDTWCLKWCCKRLLKRLQHKMKASILYVGCNNRMTAAYTNNKITVKFTGFFYSSDTHAQQTYDLLTAEKYGQPQMRFEICNRQLKVWRYGWMYVIIVLLMSQVVSFSFEKVVSPVTVPWPMS